jgi:predicted transposase YbfD/YdcC
MHYEFQSQKNEIKVYYQKLQNQLKDTRGICGRKHELAFIITCFVLAILRSTDKLSLSKIHRNMVRNHDALNNKLDSGSKKCISRVQLSRILNTLDYECFNKITANYFDHKITKDNWKAIDGKELRGSIDGVSGDKRGESIVLSVEHTTKISQVLGYYSGKKESEKTVIQNYFDSVQDLSGQKFTIDALHNSESLLTKIAGRDAFYLTQIKSNQKILLADIKHIAKYIPADHHSKSIEKEHGRIDQREVFVYPVNVECLDKRWSKSGIAKIIEVRRTRYNCKKQSESKETSFYVTNFNRNDQELAGAVREHWTVEVLNYIRDVNFGEDEIRSKYTGIQRAISSIITAITNGLQILNLENNLRVIREDMLYDLNKAYQFFVTK